MYALSRRRFQRFDFISRFSIFADDADIFAIGRRSGRLLMPSADLLQRRATLQTFRKGHDFILPRCLFHFIYAAPFRRHEIRYEYRFLKFDAGIGRDDRP